MKYTNRSESGEIEVKPSKFLLIDNFNVVRSIRIGQVDLDAASPGPISRNPVQVSLRSRQIVKRVKREPPPEEIAWARFLTKSAGEEADNLPYLSIHFFVN